MMTTLPSSDSAISLSVPDASLGMGRTPPPGSKRAAEIRNNEAQHASAYKPPALRGFQGSSLGGASLDEAPYDDVRYNSGSTGSKHDAGYRRARAGTLPTDLGANSQRYVPPATRDFVSHTSGTSTPIEDMLAAQSAVPTRPGLRHAASSAASFAADSSANRIRSGSLTLPTEEIGKAFGSAFSSAWLANPGLSSGGLKSGLSKVTSNTSSQAEELRSATSNDTTPGDELGNFSTLDYLGLEAADTPKQASFFQPASVSELRMQAQQAIANNGPSSRHRASTVSTMPRPNYKSSSSYSDLIAAATDERGHVHSGPVDAYGSYGYSGSSSSNDPYALPFGIAKGFKDEGLLNALNSRPRATTIGISEGQRRQGARGSAFQPRVGGDTSGGFIDRSRSDKEFAGMHRAIAPRHNLSSSISSRTSTPDEAGGRRDQSGATQGQVPTRSLWLGNLDVTTTAQELMQFFSPYGAIESLRLLPEKSCAFVNFVDKADAIRAKDDVLIRLGGHITELSDTPVRVGYGKIDSVPTAAPTASTMQYSLSNSSLSSLASSENGDSASPETKYPTAHASPDVSAQPTRALWVGSIPANTTPGTLLSIFSPFGAVESARVLTNKQCGFVNFETITSAIAARTALNGREILGSEVGAVKIGFAKIPVKVTSVEGGMAGGPSSDQVSQADSGVDMYSALKELKGSSKLTADSSAGGVENYGSNLVLELLQKGVYDEIKSFKASGSVAGASDAGSSKERSSDSGITEQQMIMMVLSQGDPAMAEDVLAIAEPERPALYYSYIPAMTERSNVRRFDAGTLKEIRKRLDTGACSQAEIDQIATDLLEDCVDLSSDYIGNCLIQRLFERANSNLRMAMLERIAPHLALIGTHKNGTWAAQKIIECAETPQELSIIAQNLQPYCPPLCADQYGNYVVSICLRFGEPSNQFIFNAMVDRVWDIAQTRFGARCMRTCLESHFTSSFQRKRIATAIVLHSIPLATNPNGALLLTWLVDASNLPGRYSLLAPRFAPYLSHLATHKLASLTILRIINQKLEPEAATTILDALFKSPNDQVLHEVLQDQVHGCHTVAKIICGGALPADVKPECVAATKRVLSTMRVSSSFAYRKLLEECGLPVTSSAPAGSAGRYPNGRSPPTNNGRPGYIGGSSNYPAAMGRGGGPNAYLQNGPYLNQAPANNYPVGPSAQELAMNSMMNSMQAFQLGQGMAQQGYLSPIVIPQQSFSQVMHASPQMPPMSPTPTIGSFATPHASMMSPNSDPFNPFASPTQLTRSTNMSFGTPARDDAPPFQISPSFGGLGMQAADSGAGVSQNASNYTYQPFMQPQQQMYGQAALNQKRDAGFSP